MMMRNGISWVGVALLALNSVAAESKKLYENNFEKAEAGKVPEEFLVLDGAFAVKEEAGNKSLELPGAPLDAYGLLFGPTESANVIASARVFGTGKGRRFPTFALGLNGVGGFKLQVSPGKKMIEIYKGEEVLVTSPYTWESGAWTMLRLQLRKIKEGEFAVRGKVWKQDGKEPDGWMIDYTLMGDLPAGRASVWGNPYSGTPILYDDLSLTTTDP
jgi:hypothetical protein